MSAALTTNVDQRLLRTTKFPPEFNAKVDMRKVNLPVIKKWVTDELARILKNDDDVVTELVFNIIESSHHPNIKELQISLTGFLDKDASKFCQELWKLCLSAQSNAQGVPKELLEAKKQELEQERIEQDRARDAAMKRQEADRERDRELARVRDRERQGRWERPREEPYGSEFNRVSTYRASSRSASPQRRRRDRDDSVRAAREADTYIPSKGRSSRGHKAHARRSSSHDSPQSRSHSPVPRRRRRNSSSFHSPSAGSREDGSLTRDSGSRRKDRSPGITERRRDYSPEGRYRSRSPRRYRRQYPSNAYRSRSPRPKRNRRRSPSFTRSPPPRRRAPPSLPRSRSPPRRHKQIRSLASDDLMSRSDRAPGSYRRDTRRLSPQVRGSHLHDTVDQSQGEADVGFRFLGMANTHLPASNASKPPDADALRREASLLREKELRLRVLAQNIPRRAG